VKLLIVILSDDDAEDVLRVLIESEFRVTRVASTGGFLRRGNTTLFIGTQEDRVDEAFELIRQTCGDPEEHGAHKATVFVLDMARFEQL
jgi:uncharacterized protein YaaQ